MRNLIALLAPLLLCLATAQLINLRNPGNPGQAPNLVPFGANLLSGTGAQLLQGAQANRGPFNAASRITGGNNPALNNAANAETAVNQNARAAGLAAAGDAVGQQYAVPPPQGNAARPAPAAPAFSAPAGAAPNAANILRSGRGGPTTPACVPACGANQMCVARADVQGAASAAAGEAVCICTNGFILLNGACVDPKMIVDRQVVTLLPTVASLLQNSTSLGAPFQLRTLDLLLEDSGLYRHLQGRTLTFFAPTDAAFQSFFSRAPGGLMEKLATDPLGVSSLLLYHAVPLALSPSALGNNAAVQVASMAGGSPLLLSLAGQGLAVNNAHVTKVVQCRDGWLYLIDDVLTPPAPGAPAPQPPSYNGANAAQVGTLSPQMEELFYGAQQQQQPPTALPPNNAVEIPPVDQPADVEPADVEPGAEPPVPVEAAAVVPPLSADGSALPWMHTMDKLPTDLLVLDLALELDGLAAVWSLLRRAAAAPGSVVGRLRDRADNVVFLAPDSRSLIGADPRLADALYTDDEVREALLANHVIAGDADLETPGERVLQSVGGGQLQVVVSVNGAVVINGVSVVVSRALQCANGVIYVVNQLLPSVELQAQLQIDISREGLDVTATVAAAINKDAALTGVKELVGATDLGDQLEDAGREFTVLAPIDPAWDALGAVTIPALSLAVGAAVDINKELAMLPNLLVVDRKALAVDIEVGACIALPTLAGEALTLCKRADLSLVVDDWAVIIRADLECSNGVVHLLDRVPLPKALAAALPAGALAPPTPASPLGQTLAVDSILGRASLPWMLANMAGLHDFAGLISAADADNPVAAAAADVAAVARPLDPLRAIAPAPGTVAAQGTAQSFTLFVPTQTAWQALSPAQLVALGLAPGQGVDALTGLALEQALAGHVLEGAYDSAALLDLQEPTLNSLSGSPLTFSASPSGQQLLVNGALVVRPDLRLSDTVIVHVVESVLVASNQVAAQDAAAPVGPAFPDLTVARALGEIPAAASFMLLCEGTGVETLLDDTTHRYSVLVPTNAALSAFVDAVGGAVATLSLDQLRLYHIVRGLVTVADMTPTAALTSLSGLPLAAAANRAGRVTLNGAATIVVRDIRTSNGVIHLVDAVLAPLAPRQPPQQLQQQGAN